MQEFELGKHLELPVLNFDQGPAKPPKFSSTPARGAQPPQSNQAAKRDRPFTFTLTPHSSPRRLASSYKRRDSARESTYEYARPRRVDVSPPLEPQWSQTHSQPPSTNIGQTDKIKAPLIFPQHRSATRTPLEAKNVAAQPLPDPESPELAPSRPTTQTAQRAPKAQPQAPQPQPRVHMFPDLSASALEESFQTPPPRPQPRGEFRWQPQMWVTLAKMCNLFPPNDDSIPPQIRREFGWLSEAELKTRLAVLKKWDRMAADRAA